MGLNPAGTMQKAVDNCKPNTLSVEINRVWRDVRAVRWMWRALGLLARTPLARPSGLWLAPCASGHTLGMRLTIDKMSLPVSIGTRCRGLCLLVGLLASAAAPAATLAENPTLLKQRVAALFAGHYVSASCAEQPNPDGRPPVAGDLRITPDGQIWVGPERAALFDPAGELAFTRDLKARQLSLDVRAGDRMARLASTDDTFRQASIEIGRGSGM